MFFALKGIGEAEARIGVSNADEFIVFRNALATGERTGFDLSGAKTDGKMRD